MIVCFAPVRSFSKILAYRHGSQAWRIRFAGRASPSSAMSSIYSMLVLWSRESVKRGTNFAAAIRNAKLVLGMLGVNHGRLGNHAVLPGLRA